MNLLNVSPMLTPASIGATSRYMADCFNIEWRDLPPSLKDLIYIDHCHASPEDQIDYYENIGAGNLRSYAETLHTGMLRSYIIERSLAAVPRQRMAR